MGIQETIDMLLEMRGKKKKETVVITNLLFTTNLSLKEIAKVVEVPLYVVREMKERMFDAFIAQ